MGVNVKLRAPVYDGSELEVSDIFKNTSIFPDETPRHVYHYTTMEGLQGIVSTGSLFATEITSLNDSSELVYADQIIRKYTASADSSDLGRQLLTELNETLDRGRVDLYVSCFCDSGDLLSQWRAYAAQGAGYALEFDWNRIEKKCADVENALPGRIEYDEACQEQLVASVIASCFGDWTKKDQQGYLVNTLISIKAEQIRAQTVGQPKENIIAAVREATKDGTWWTITDEAKSRMAKEMLDPLARSMMALYICRGFLKSRGFAEEREWRVLAIRPSEDTSCVQFRISKGILIPYITLDLRDDDGNLPIERIIVGPTASQTNAKRSLERFLKCKGLRNVTVEGSSIPLL